MKKISAIIACLLLSLSFSACGEAKLPDGITQEDVTAAAEAVIENLNAGKFTEIVDATRYDVQSQLSAEVLQQVYDSYVQPLGAFTEFGKTSIKTTTDNASEDEYIVAVIQAKYANGTVTYTVALDNDMKIVGFYLK